MDYIIREGIYEEACSAEATAFKGKLGSFHAVLLDKYGKPIPCGYVGVGEWAAVTSPNGIVYLDKLSPGEYEMKAYISGQEVKVVPMVKIDPIDKPTVHQYIYDPYTDVLKEIGG